MENITITAVIAALIQLVLHYFPWQLALRRKLPRHIAYSLGVLGIVLPLTWLYRYWLIFPPLFRWEYLAALWVVTGASGLAVYAAYGLDWVLQQLVKVPEMEELMIAKGAHNNEIQGQVES